MKIVIVSSLFAPFATGGAEQVAGQVAETLHREGHTVNVVSTCRESDLDGKAFCADTWNGIPVWRIAPWNVYWRVDQEAKPPGRLARTAWHAIDLWNPSVVKRLAAIFDKLQPEVVNTHNIDGLSPLVWRTARNHKAAVVHTLHDYHLTCPRAVMQRRDGTACRQLCAGCRVYATYFRFYQRYVDAIISPSQTIANIHASAGWTAPKNTVIHNAVEASGSVALANPSVGPLQVAFMSRLVPEKGCETFLKALEHFRDRNDVHFHVAGEGAYAEQFANIADRASNVTWHGYVRNAEKAALLSGADVFLQLSECWENAPLSLLEAKSHGLYVIGTDIGSIPEFIDQPATGRVIRPADLRSLVDVIEDQIATVFELRQGRSERVAKCGGYSVQEMVQRYVQVFASAVQTRGAMPTLFRGDHSDRRHHTSGAEPQG